MTPSISSTATTRIPTSRSEHSKPRKNAGADVLVPVRHQRRHASRSASARWSRWCGSASAASIGIHAHNDSDVAVANTLAAVEAGATHVQGCMNGYGERCGNANLCLDHRQPRTEDGPHDRRPASSRRLTDVARYIADRANLPLRNDQPFVGKSAFAHKGGVHVSAVLKDARPTSTSSRKLIGNRQRVLLSDLSGRSNIKYKLEQHGLAEGLDEDSRKRLLETHQGDGARGLRLRSRRRQLRTARPAGDVSRQGFFSLVGYDVTTKAYGGNRSEDLASIIIERSGPSALQHRYGPGSVRRAAQRPLQVHRGPLPALRQASSCATTRSACSTAAKVRRRKFAC